MGYGSYCLYELARGEYGQVVKNWYCRLDWKGWYLNPEKEKIVEKVTVAGAASILHVTTRRVRQLMKEGRLKASYDPQWEVQVLELEQVKAFMLERAAVEARNSVLQEQKQHKDSAIKAVRLAKSQEEMRELLQREGDTDETVRLTRGQLADYEWDRRAYRLIAQQDRMSGLCVRCGVCGTVEPLSLWRSLLFTRKQAEYPPACGHGWADYGMCQIRTQADEEPLWNHEAYPISKDS